jgi:hypothetical protein
MLLASTQRALHSCEADCRSRGISEKVSPPSKFTTIDCRFLALQFAVINHKGGISFALIGSLINEINNQRINKCDYVFYFILNLVRTKFASIYLNVKNFSCKNNFPLCCT